MATTPEEGGTSIPGRALSDEQSALAQKLIDYLKGKWGDPPPNCPFCRTNLWIADPQVVLFPTASGEGAASGAGIPVFLIRCDNCGTQYPLGVAASGLWEDALGEPPPPPRN